MNRGARSVFVVLQLIFTIAAIYFAWGSNWAPATYYLVWAVMMRIVLTDIRLRMLIAGKT